MKQFLLKNLSIILSTITTFSATIPAFAYDVDENGNSVEMIEYQNTQDDDFTNATTVFAELKSIYNVTIPKTVVLSGESKDATYFVKAEGDIAGYETLNIVPDDNFNLYTKNKDLQIANITQDKTAWKYTDFDTDANGIIDAEHITAGKWQGTFNFNIFLKDLEEKVAGDIILPHDLDEDYRLIISKLQSSQPGLYDDKGELIKSYDYLVLHDNISKNTIYGSENNPETTNAFNEIINTNYVNTNYIVLPETIETIKKSSLDIENLKYVRIPETTQTIENNAFGDNLIYVQIPKTVTKMGLQPKVNLYNTDKPVREINIDLENNDSVGITLEKGYTYKIEALYNFTDDVTGNSTITSSNKSVADYRPVYYLDTFEVGTTTFTGIYNAHSGKKQASIKVKVVDTHEHIQKGPKKENYIQPKCLEKGSYDEIYYCATCNKILQSTHKEVDMLGHSFKGDICSRCGYKMEYQAGLYDSNNNLLKSWDELVAMGLAKNLNDAFITINQINNGTKLILSNDVTEIARNAFNHCDYLKEVIISDSVTSIGNNAFSGLKYLEKVTIGNGVTDIYSNAFSGCDSLKEVKFGKSVKNIHERAFFTCINLNNFELPNSLEYIGTLAFAYNTSLTEINIPDSVKSMGDQPFGGCSLLKKVTIGSSIKAIPTEAFYYCRKLEEINIKGPVEVIGSSAFLRCESLKEITLPDTITCIYSNAFGYCISLKTIHLPSNLTTMYDGIFDGCESLEKIVLPDTLTKVEHRIFRNCTSLASVKLPSNVTYIGDSTFNGCSSLKEITIPSTLKTISNFGFAGCTSLEVTVPSSVTLIGDRAFDGAPHIYYNGPAYEGRPWGAKKLN